jgi:hypothetical protein
MMTAACSPNSERRPDSIASAVASAPAVAPWIVTVRGIGPVEAGLTVSEVARRLGRALVAPPGADTATDTLACGYVRIPDGPPGVWVMIEHGTVARVEVRDGTVATAEGGHIGDSEERIATLYAGRAVVTPQKYTPGHDLTVRSNTASDSAFRLVFETDGRVVTRYRAGRLPAVSYVEGCG